MVNVKAFVKREKPPN